MNSGKPPSINLHPLISRALSSSAAPRPQALQTQPQQQGNKLGPTSGSTAAIAKQPQPHPKSQRPSWGLMKLPAVKEATAKSRSTIYSEIAAGRFPKPIKIGPRSIAWREDTIRAHIDAQERGETPIYPVAE